MTSRAPRPRSSPPGPFLQVVAVRARGHFPNEQAALKVLYLAVRSLDPKGTGQVRWIARWKPILNVIGVSFQHRMPETANL